MFTWALVVCAAHAGSDPSEPGRFAVGVTTIIVERTDKPGRKLVTEAWYPTLERGRLLGPKYRSGMRSNASRGSSIAAGPFPCVVFSHGMGAMREQSTFLTEHLASHGYFVVAPDHTNNTIRDLELAGNIESALDRPMDVRAVIDQTLKRSADPDDPFFGRIQHDRIAVMGHSLGGYTALAVGGAWVNGRAHPAHNSDPNWPDYLDYTDNRVRAVVALAPYTRPAFNAFGLAQLHRPTLIVGGTADGVASIGEHLAPAFEKVSGERFLVVVQGASHLSFCNEEFAGILPSALRFFDRATIDRARSEAIVRRLVVAFLELHLSESRRFAAHLSTATDFSVDYRSASANSADCAFSWNRSERNALRHRWLPKRRY